MISPNPSAQHHPGGGTVTFTFGASTSGGTGGSCSFAWSNGDTGPSTTFNEHAPPSDEADGTIGVLATDLTSGEPASDSADWVALGF